MTKRDFAILAHTLKSLKPNPDDFKGQEYFSSKAMLYQWELTVRLIACNLLSRDSKGTFYKACDLDYNKNY